MQNNVIGKISPVVRMLCLFILSVSLLLAKSIFLILFITTLILILMVITGKRVNLYVNIIKNSYILLLFLLIIYIIMFEYNLFNWLIFVFKLIVITLSFSVFHLNTNFNQLHQAIYGFIKPLEKIKINAEGVSFDIVVALFFIKSLVDNKLKLLKKQEIYGKRKLNLKNYVLPIFINSANELNEFQLSLKAKFYKLKYKESDKFSKRILIVFITVFILVVMKEVIL